MSRRPVSSINVLQTRGAIWAAIRELGRFTIPELRKQTRCSDNQVRDYAAGLTAAGILTRDGASYTLAKDQGVEPPRVRRDGTAVTQGLGTEQMWRTMRLLGEFTALDLSVQASTEENPVRLETAKGYCKYLQRAGYLATVRQGKGVGSGGVLTRYRFIPTRHSGPLAPMIQRVRQVYDPNLGQVVWSQEEGRHDPE